MGGQVIRPKWSKLPPSVFKITLEIKLDVALFFSFNSLGSCMHFIKKQDVEKGSSKWRGKTASDARTSRRLEEEMECNERALKKVAFKKVRHEGHMHTQRENTITPVATESDIS